jgi:CRP-like cAMP-binding protein
VQALTNITLCGFDAGELTEEIYKSRGTVESLAERLVREGAEADQRAVGLARRNAGERVAGLILRITNRLKKRDLAHGESFEFPLRQEHIADALGLTPVHVSRTFSIMRGAGIISLDRNMITIKDRPALVEFAGKNDAPALV